MLACSIHDGVCLCHMIAWSFERAPVGFQGMTFWACVLIGLFIPIEICNREGFIFRERHVLVKTYAALARTASDVVLHTVAFEVGDAAIVHLDRHVHHHDALRSFEGFNPA